MEKLGSIEERNAAAAQILKIRSHERQRNPEHIDGWQRDLIEYFKYIGGLSSYLEYLGKLGNQMNVLDIGSGTNKGITELARTRLGRSYNFIATNLSRVPGSIDDTKPVKIIHTSAEVLRGIEDKSINGIIAIASIAYSEAPTLVASSFDRVLVPGGAIKASFKRINRENDFSIDFKYKDHYPFSSVFLEMGYDVSVDPRVDEAIMVAIKPGGPPAQSAEDLLKIDTPFTDRMLYLGGYY